MATIIEVIWCGVVYCARRMMTQPRSIRNKIKHINPFLKFEMECLLFHCVLKKHTHAHGLIHFHPDINFSKQSLFFFCTHSGWVGKIMLPIMRLLLQTQPFFSHSLFVSLSLLLTLDSSVSVLYTIFTLLKCCLTNLIYKIIELNSR